MSEYAHVTLTITVEACDCKEAIEQVESHLGESDELAVSWPTIEKVRRGDYND